VISQAQGSKAKACRGVLDKFHLIDSSIALIFLLGRGIIVCHDHDILCRQGK
jgi:hypothetical protein